MAASPMTYIIIPAYDEAQVISSVVNSIQKSGFRNIIVVDDGSGDNTEEVAKKAGAITMRHIINRGKGAAVKTGIEAAKLRGADIIVTFDGDGQHSADDIQLLVETITHGYDVVLGTRKRNGAMPLIRKVANTIGNIITWMLYGIRVSDSQCGLRAYTRVAYNHFETLNDRYEYDTEIIREIAHHRLRYTEIGIETRYTQYSTHKKTRQSFINGIRTLIRLIAS